VLIHASNMLIEGGTKLLLSKFTKKSFFFRCVEPKRYGKRARRWLALHWIHYRLQKSI